MTFQEEQLRLTLALFHTPGIKPSQLRELLDNKEVELGSLFDAKGYCNLSKRKVDWPSVERDLRWSTLPDCYVLSRRDSKYPSLLRIISNSPPILFIRGNPHLLSRPQLAMVGSRNPTPLGYETAKSFAHHFSSKGFVVTSGLAVGIDGASHKGALLETGNTIAVLGNGLDSIYPSSHQDLAGEIVAKGGALVSEFSIGVPPAASHFPRRNRIISGLTMGTLVVEAAVNSGSLITAKFALEQGREVFAIPGSIHNPLVKGCHALIKQGAKLVETADDVLEELGALTSYVLHSKEGKAPPEALPIGRQSLYEELLTQIGYDGTPMDTIIARSGLTAKAVSSMLLELELKGYITSVPGGYARLLA